MFKLLHKMQNINLEKNRYSTIEKIVYSLAEKLKSAAFTIFSTNPGGAFLVVILVPYIITDYNMFHYNICIIYNICIHYNIYMCFIIIYVL